MFAAYKDFVSRMFQFNGTSTRSQFWWVVIINYLIGGILGNMTYKGDSMVIQIFTININIISFAIAALIWFATLTLTVRRLHDTNHSGFWILLQFVPVIGWIWLVILWLLPSTKTKYA